MFLFIPFASAGVSFEAVCILNEKPQFRAVHNHGQNILDTFNVLSKLGLSKEVL